MQEVCLQASRVPGETRGLDNGPHPCTLTPPGSVPCAHLLILSHILPVTKLEQQRKP